MSENFQLGFEAYVRLLEENNRSEVSKQNRRLLSVWKL